MRVWKDVSGTPSSASESRFRVLQYNVLAESLAESSDTQCSTDTYSCPSHLMQPGSAGKHFYRNPIGPCHLFRTAKTNLTWDYRFPLILREILSHGPDIICLQEVDVNRFEDFKLALNEAGYEGLYCKKAWKKTKDGSAVFWRSARFLLQCSEAVLLKRDTNMKALLVKLAAPAGILVTVCCTHLKCGMENENIRLEQIGNLEKSLELFAAGTAIILCGDLNSHFAPIRLCTSECCCDTSCTFEPKVIPALESSGFRNAYARFPSFTTWCGFEDRDVKATFDYILTKGPVETCAVLELPSEEYVVQFAERLPNSTCPSDHLCLVADLEFGMADTRHVAKLQQLGIRKVPQTILAQQQHKTCTNVDMEVESTSPGSSDSE